MIYHVHMTTKEIIKRLKKNGWRILRIRGSHCRMGKGEKRTTVPLHGSRPIGKGLLKALERQTGVSFK